MKLTDWLGHANALDIIPAGELHELRWWDIKFLDQSMQLSGNGLLVAAPVMTEVSVRMLARADNWRRPPLGPGLWVVGYRLTEAVVQLLLPMRPTSLIRDPVKRNDALLADLRRAGF